jgi:hypothetical protein
MPFGNQITHDILFHCNRNLKGPSRATMCNTVSMEEPSFQSAATDVSIQDFRRFRKIAKKDYLIYVCLSVCMSVCPSVRPHKTTRLSHDGFS